MVADGSVAPVVNGLDYLALLLWFPVVANTVVPFIFQEPKLKKSLWDPVPPSLPSPRK